MKNSILSFLGRPSFFLGDPSISFPTCIYHKKVHEKGINKFYKRDNDQTRSIRRAIHPHAVISSKVEKYSSHSALSCSLRRSIPVFRYHTYDIIPSCKKDPSTSLGMTLRKLRFPNISFIRDVGYPSPIPSFRAQSRNPPCTLFFLAPFAEDFQFYFVTHTTLYRCARKIEGFARDDVAEMAFSKHIRCTLREINPFPPYRHFERSEKSSLHSALSCSFRKRFPLFRYLTYDAIPVCKKDRGLRSG